MRGCETYLGSPIKDWRQVYAPPEPNELGALSLDTSMATIKLDDADGDRFHHGFLTDYQVCKDRGESFLIRVLHQAEKVDVQELGLSLFCTEQLFTLVIGNHDLTARNVADQARLSFGQLHLQYAAHIELALMQARIPRLRTDRSRRGNEEVLRRVLLGGLHRRSQVQRAVF